MRPVQRVRTETRAQVVRRSEGRHGRDRSDGSEGRQRRSGERICRGTVVVSPGATATASGTRLLAALQTITNASPPPSSTNPYLLALEPGTYDLGAESLALPSYVALAGSGREITRITSTVASASCDLPALTAATLVGAAHSEVREVTLANTGGGIATIAVLVPPAAIPFSIRDARVTTDGTPSPGLPIPSFPCRYAVLSRGGTAVDRASLSAAERGHDDRALRVWLPRKLGHHTETANSRRRGPR